MTKKKNKHSEYLVERILIPENSTIITVKTENFEKLLTEFDNIIIYRCNGNRYILAEDGIVIEEITNTKKEKFL